MPSTEYFPGDKSGAYPLMVEAAVPIEEHPLSASGVLLPPETKYAQIRTHLGDATIITPENTDGLVFVEETQPAVVPRGPVVSYSVYEGVLKTQAVDKAKGRSVPLPATDWIDHQDSGWLFQSGIPIGAHVEVPVDPNDHQVRATLFYSDHTPRGRQRVDGVTFANSLQNSGFAPGAFRDLRVEAEVHKQLMDRTVEQGRALYQALGMGDQYDVAKLFATGMMSSLFRYSAPIQGLDRVVRTSRHRRA